MNFFANLLKIILIIALIGGVGYACYALFFKPVPTTNVLSEYEKVMDSHQNKVILDNLSLHEQNHLNQYSQTLDSTYDEALLLYYYEMDILALTLPEATFGKQSGVMTKVSQYLGEYQAAIVETANAINIFNTDKATFGNAPTPAQVSTLNGEFKYIAECVFDQAKILSNINTNLLPYVKSEIFGGDNVAKFNTKYLNIEALYKQGVTLLQVLQSEQGVVGNRFFADCQQLYATFCVRKVSNFNRVDAVLTDKFVADYAKIDKTAFFYALDKAKYYNELEDATKKQAVQTVITYFGFDINTAGGE